MLFRFCLQATRHKSLFLLITGLFLFAPCAVSQEAPYFVAYSDALEEPGNLEIAFKGLQAAPKAGNAFTSGTLELEYGLKAYWTTEVYLSGQSTQNDSTLFTGFRWENRFRPLMREHRVNPVLYVEYEDINGADRSLLEVVNHDSIDEVRGRNAIARKEIQRELELKLILSSNARGWDISENFIFEKSLSPSDSWEFGYALGVSRPFSLRAASHDCLFCRENFSGGLEMYGGLGTTQRLGLPGTSHYLGPMIQMQLPKGPAIAFEPSFGLNANSVGVLWRFRVSYEVQQLFGHFRKGAQ